MLLRELPIILSEPLPPIAFSISQPKAIAMLFVMLLQEEKRPGRRSMKLAVDHPLRSRVSLPPLSKMVRIGFLLREKSKIKAELPAMFELKPYIVSPSRVVVSTP